MHDFKKPQVLELLWGSTLRVGFKLASKYFIRKVSHCITKRANFGKENFIVQSSGKNITISLAKTQYNYRHVKLMGKWVNMSGS
jgi:hypothetical protein